jgi:hypothetical protein
MAAEYLVNELQLEIFRIDFFQFLPLRKVMVLLNGCSKSIPNVFMKIEVRLMAV